MRTVEVGEGDPFRPRAVEAETTDFVECYLRHYGRLVRALRLSGADAGTSEELAQEAFARALTKWPRISQGANPPGYVYTTGFRLLQRHLARAARWDIGDPPEPADPDSDRTGSAAIAAVTVAQALAAMPPKRRACAVMCLLVGVSTEEASAALGVAAGTVRKHLEEARRQLAPIRGA